MLKLSGAIEDHAPSDLINHDFYFDANVKITSLNGTLPKAQNHLSTSKIIFHKTTVCTFNPWWLANYKTADTLLNCQSAMSNLAAFLLKTTLILPIWHDVEFPQAKFHPTTTEVSWYQSCFLFAPIYTQNWSKILVQHSNYHSTTDLTWSMLLTKRPQ